MSSNVKISVLDLMPHRPDQSQHQTMLNTIDAARALNLTVTSASGR